MSDKLIDLLEERAKVLNMQVVSVLREMPTFCDMQDIDGRYVHVSLMHGAYGQPSTLVIVINGSPPRGTIIVDLYAYFNEYQVRAWLMRHGHIRKIVERRRNPSKNTPITHPVERIIWIARLMEEYDDGRGNAWREMVLADNPLWPGGEPSPSK